MSITINLLISHTDLDGYGAQLMNLIRLDKASDNPLKIIESMYNSKDKDSRIKSMGADSNITVSKGVLEYFIFYNFDYNTVDEGIRNIFNNNNVTTSYVTYNVYITDINISMETADFLYGLRLQGVIDYLEVIDHHVTGLEVSERYPEWYKLTNGTSATKLVFDKYCKDIIGNTYINSITDLVNVINAADVFNTEDNDVFESGRCLNNILEPIFRSIKIVEHSRFLIFTYLLILINSKSRSLVHDILEHEDNRGRERIKMLFNLLHNLIDNEPFSYDLINPDNKIGTPLHVLYYKNQVSALLSLGTTVTLNKNNEDIRFLVVDNYTQSISDVSYYTLLSKPDLDFIVFILRGKNILSFRSFESTGEDGNKYVRYDVSELAKKFNGGGHRAAAGCVLAYSMTETEVINMIKENV